MDERSHVAEGEGKATAAALAGAAPADARFRRFGDFWPYYLREHSRPATRRLHYAGTGLVLLIAATAASTGRWRLLIALPLAGYGFAWLAHFAVERNRPATFRHPLWSLAADGRMFWLWLTGRLDRDLEGAGVLGRGTGEHGHAG